MANGRAAKALIYDTLGIKVNARQGRGTSFAWLYIDMREQPLPPTIRDVITQLCLRNGLCGTYLNDNDDTSACIRFENVEDK